MTRVRARIGPKGQVVIPKVVRKALGVGPGSEVIFSIEEEEVVLRASRTDVVDVFERIAKAGTSIGERPPHEAYERDSDGRARDSHRQGPVGSEIS